ncbi:MAG: Maf family protein [Ilumatobacteraceae bacterium]
MSPLRPGDRVVLASSSPRRLDLLRSLGLDPAVVVSPDVDETPLAAETPREHVARLAAAKLAAVVGTDAATSVGWSRWRAAPGDVVIAADTTIDLDGRIVAKPADDDDAVRMLTMLSGREHEVHTGVAVRCGDEVAVEVVTTTVVFRRLDPTEIARYVATGEPRDKAGAYALQGGAAGFVREVRGSRSNVIGLPLDAVCRLLGLPAGPPPVSLAGPPAGSAPDPQDEPSAAD